jgi:hypothetical protein
MKFILSKITIYISVIFLNFLAISVSGQQLNIDHDHLHDNHKYHVGFGVAGTHLSGETGIAPGFHLHFIRQLGHEKHWGIGLGYEAIIEETLHNSFNLLANFRPFDFLSFIAGPGLVFGKHDGKTEILPAFHTEAVFEFNLGKIHLGPMIGFGIDKEESHFSVGLHVGIGF